MISTVSSFYVEVAWSMDRGGGRGGARVWTCESMSGSDWWRDDSIVQLFGQSMQAVSGSTPRLSSIRRVCFCHFFTPPGQQSFQAEVTVDSRLQVKMNSLKLNSAEQEENKDIGMLLYLPPFNLLLVCTCVTFQV